MKESSSRLPASIRTIEGSVIIFQCDPGFSPVAEMTVICNSSGQWSSDLSQLLSHTLVVLHLKLPGTVTILVRL